MASSINDLERLSLDLPDVVVEAEKVEKPKRGRGRRCLRRNLQKSQPQSQQSQQQGGARALTPVEDKRVPDSSIVEAVFTDALFNCKLLKRDVRRSVMNNGLSSVIKLAQLTDKD